MDPRVTADEEPQRPTTTVTRIWPPITDLPGLRTAFPDFGISEDRRRTPPRFSAVAKDSRNAGLAAIVTADLEELARHLRDATGRVA